MRDGTHIDAVFTYHAPGEGDQERYQAIRAGAQMLAQVILDTCPACADRSDALRKVREAVMTANASIALKGVI